jgi:hypothetical protein
LFHKQLGLAGDVAILTKLRYLLFKFVRIEPGSMNRFERRPISAGEAEIEYLDGEFRILRPGTFVRCAVTGVPIKLEDLRYWNVDLQEPYASPEAKLQRLGIKPKPSP